MVAWLHDGLVDRLSPAAVASIENGHLQVSAMVKLELEYLHEIGRLRPDAASVLAALERDVGLTLSGSSFPSVVAEACSLGWARDPFDRIIAADALVAGARLVTKDGTMLEHLAIAVW